MEKNQQKSKVEENEQAIVDETELSSEKEALIEKPAEVVAEEQTESLAAEQTEALMPEEAENGQQEQMSALPEGLEAEPEEQTEALLNEEAEMVSEEHTEALLTEETEMLVEETEMLVEETEALIEEQADQPDSDVKISTEPFIIEHTESLLYKQKKVRNINKPAVIIGSIIIGLVLIGGGIAGYLNYMRISSISDGLKNGETLLTETKYDEAMKAFEAVAVIDPENADMIFGKGKASAGIGDYGNAKTYYEDALKRITDLEKMKLIYNAYIDSEVKAKVNDETLFALLDRAAKETGDEGYIKKKGEFMVKAPSFNLNPGAYQGVQSVDIIKGDPADKVYFTTDGSQPTTASPEYTAVIQLVPGEITIKAIEVGANGYPSKTVEGKYSISQSSEAILENNISGSWISRSGLSVTQYYFNNGYCSYTYTYGNYSPSTSTANYQIMGVNSSGTIATLSLFNMQGYSLPGTLNINCEPLGDNMISINQRGFSYNP